MVHPVKALGPSISRADSVSLNPRDSCDNGRLSADILPFKIHASMRGNVTSRCAWYFPCLSLYEISHGSSL